MQAPAPVTGRHDAIAPEQLFHARNHFSFIGSTVVEAFGG